MDWIDILVRIVIIVVCALDARYVVPWMRNKGIYDEVKRLVSAAEKWAENHNIDKLEWVIEGLQDLGIRVTPQVRRWIETAVMELDLAIGMSTTPDIGALLGEEPTEKE